MRLAFRVCMRCLLVRFFVLRWGQLRPLQIHNFRNAQFACVALRTEWPASCRRMVCMRSVNIEVAEEEKRPYEGTLGPEGKPLPHNVHICTLLLFLAPILKGTERRSRGTVVFARALQA
eukprot:scaffold96539_cov21-Tisochrysis_lutea.AAC.1